MSYFSIDVESDDQSPATGSMVCFGAVKVADPSKTFYGKTAPITENYNPEALSISGFSRQEHEAFKPPIYTMKQFFDWVIENNEGGRPIFICDNPAFDWQWINFYFHRYIGENPFGHSARRIGDLYCGLVKHGGKNHDWKKKYRKTRHTHNPVDDAMGNAEALIAFRDILGLKISY